MSNPNQTFSYSASASFSSFSSSSNGTTRSYSEIRTTDPSGTKVHRTSQEPGQAPREERLQYDSAGRRIEDAGIRGRIEDVTDKGEQEGKDREYEERIQDEYAKREGGA